MPFHFRVHLLDIRGSSSPCLLDCRTSSIIVASGFFSVGEW
jgi:hypothetical protein